MTYKIILENGSSLTVEKSKIEIVTAWLQSRNLAIETIQTLS